MRRRTATPTACPDSTTELLAALDANDGARMADILRRRPRCPALGDAGDSGTLGLLLPDGHLIDLEAPRLWLSIGECAACQKTAEAFTRHPLMAIDSEGREAFLAAFSAPVSPRNEAQP